MTTAITPGTKEFRKELATLRKSYGDAISEFRRPLYYYCLSLTRDPIDAEDLNQETLLRCFAKFSEIWEGISNLKAYHFRTASNIWINRLNRAEHDLLAEPESIADDRQRTYEDRDIRELAILVAATLAPTERACFMLKDVLEFSLEEISGMLGCSVGAVKSALSRARAKLEEVKVAKQHGSKRKLRASRIIVDDLANALNARNLDEASRLFSKQAVGDVVGCGYEIGLEAIRNGSLGVNASYDEFVRAQVFEWRGEFLIALWAKSENDNEPTANAVLYVEEQEGQLTPVRTFYYTPFVLEELKLDTGIPFQPIGKFPFEDQ